MKTAHTEMDNAWKKAATESKGLKISFCGVLITIEIKTHNNKIFLNFICGAAKDFGNKTK